LYHMITLTLYNIFRTYWMIISSLRSTDSNLLSVPRIKTVFGSRGFFHSEPVTWNSLSQNLRCQFTLDSFNKSLKTHFFKSFSLLSATIPRLWIKWYSLKTVRVINLCMYVCMYTVIVMRYYVIYIYYIISYQI